MSALQEVLALSHAGVSLKFHPPSPIVRSNIERLLTREPTTPPWIRSFEPHEVFIDAGANIGLYSVYASVVTGARVYSFEPEAQNYAELNKNIFINGLHETVTAYCVALTDHSALAKERAEKIAIARAQLAKHAPPIDFMATFDSLDVLEKVVRHFYLRGLIEQSMGVEADWKAVDAALVQAASIAKEVAKYRHAALSAVRLAGDINAKATLDGASLDELLVKIKDQLRKLGPLIDLEAIREPQGSRTEGGLTAGSRTNEHGWRSRA
jgi:FkbM family methyltransferase